MTALPVADAEAGIPIPCFSTKFLKDERTPAVRDATGRPILPYYLVHGCSDGKWDGYKSSDGKYNKLTPDIVARLPEPPGFWSAAWSNLGKFWVEWLWLVVGSMCAFGYVMYLISEALLRLEAGRQRPAGSSVASRGAGEPRRKASAATGSFGKR